MKRILYIIAFPVLFFYSCSNSLNPYAPPRPRYILNGIINNDSPFQVVTITESYRPPNFNPTTDTEDVSIKGAEVNIWYNDTLYALRDSSINRQDTSRYSSKVNFYYCNNLKPGPNSDIEIQALLPNGLLLSSVIRTPDVEYDFFDPASVTVLDPNLISQVYVGWKDLGNVYYAPKISIIYYQKGDTTQKEIAVPLNYVNQNGSQVPNYPQPTKINFFNIDISTINQVMSSIAGSDKNKSDFTVSKMMVDLIVYDSNLSTYFSSLQQSIDGFTVQLDASDYSNITGGFGIFGSYYKVSYRIDITRAYINSFGYN